MNLQKKIIYKIFIILLLISVFLVSCEGKKMQPEESLNHFSKLIESENLDGISLTIYFMDLGVFTLHPISVDDLIAENHTHKIDVNSDQLKEHSNLLKKIGNTSLISLTQEVNQKTYVDARIYYVFKDKKDQKIFDVAMWGVNLSEEDEYLDECIYK